MKSMYSPIPQLYKAAIGCHIFSTLGKFIYSWNRFHFHYSRYRHCWDLWPCLCAYTLGASHQTQCLPSAQTQCPYLSLGDCSVWPQGVSRVLGLWDRVPTLNASGLLCWESQPVLLHSASSCHCWLSLQQLSGVPAAVTSCFVLHPIVRMMAWGWIYLCSGDKCVDFMTVIFHTEDIFFFFISKF